MPTLAQQTYVVGPGPVSMRCWTGKISHDFPTQGNYTLATTDVEGPRLCTGRMWPTREDAQREADWTNRGIE